MIDRKIIEELAAEELVDANTKHDPTFHSAHEAYAVLKEEVEELIEEVKEVEYNLNVMWNKVKEDRSNKEVLTMMKYYAISAVQEAIQVIAMCDKALNCTEK